jgi:hypothetical protein
MTVTSDELPGVREIRQFLPDFRADGLRRWRSLHLSCKPSGENQLVVLTIQAEYSDDYVVEIEMAGVSELRLPEMRGWYGFDDYVIEDVRDWQWEGVRYRVEECENGWRFRCLCCSVSFTKLLVVNPDGSETVLWDAAGTKKNQ